MEEKMDLRELLEDVKLTQAQLAKELDVPLQTVQDWVNGTGKLPTDSCYEKLANALMESEEAHTVELLLDRGADRQKCGTETNE